MVHVSSAGGRHKMLPFASTEPPLNTIDTIITVNTKELCLNSSSSSPSPSSSNSSDPATFTTDINRDLHIIAEEPIITVSSLIHNIQFDAANGKLRGGKMNRNQDGNNGNANFLADSINSNHNMNTTLVDSDGLQLISHGLTDSICESLKLLDNDNDNSNNSEQNKVYTEEIVITSKKTVKTGIMKTTAHVSKSSHTTNIKEDDWHQHSIHMEEGSFNQMNDFEDTPLLTTESTFTDSTVLITEKTHGIGSAEHPNNESPNGTPTSSCPPSTQNKHGKLANGAKQTGLKRVSFGSSKGSMVETLVYESPVSEEPEKVPKSGTVAISNGIVKGIHSTDDNDASQDANGGSTGGSRPPSRVRVTFFESEKPLAVSSPESDIIDFDLSNMTLPGSPNAVDHTPTYNRQMSEGWDNPFRPDGDLSKEADQIVELIKEGKPINEETLRSKSPSVNETFTVSQQNQLNASPRGKEFNGTTANGGGGPDTVQHGVVAPAAHPSQVEHVVLKKKKGCCVIQ